MKKTATVVAASGIMALSIGCAAIAQDSSHQGHGAATATAAATAPSKVVDLINAQGQSAGRVTLKQGPSGLLMVVEAQGLTPGWHGIHLHATAQCEAPFTSAGAHINHADPKVPHGLLNAAGPDDGDLPNIFADANGVAKAELFTTRARLAGNYPGQDLMDDDGSAIIIHANADDHTSQPIGGAGDRVACATIKHH
ncbi:MULTISPECIES: superoxide dismutase family protein [unclassified Brevundimonas]|uniref:superoxide dismutase family protein n=1 Tax=unclassified Brevundimonas TaxID=2622653 RepID=UPI0025C26ABF|nr:MULTISPECIES: superoxide dismutase family protein [unclassified Brevundimonas]